jgi:hypothetical protein
MTAQDAAALWQSHDAGAWQRAYNAYGDVVARQDAGDLPDLDRWYRNELVDTLSTRRPPHLEPDELVGVTLWKMRRGEWRPRNLALVKSNDPAAVRTATEQAFASVDTPRRALDHLCTLAGVGAATASAVLAAFRPDLYPFLDDLVGAALPELGEPKFTVPYYLRYAEALRQRAADLGTPWTAQAIGLALWSASGGKSGQTPSPRGRGLG